MLPGFRWRAGGPGRRESSRLSMPQHSRRISMILAGSLLASTGAALATPASAGRGERPSGAPPAGAAAAQAVAAAGSLAVSPQPGTPDASPGTQISFLGVPAAGLGTVTVTGSRTGSHAGKLEAYASAPGASFVPDHPFRAGETVHVRLTARPGSLVPSEHFSFTVAVPGPQSLLPRGVKAQASARSKSLPTQHFVSRPALRPPRVQLSKNDPGTAPGDLFLAPLSVGVAVGPQRGPMIVDPQGRLLWFYPVSRHVGAENFQAQQLNGSPVLTWWQGVINPLGYGQGDDVVLNSSYRTVARLRGGNGERADLHEFLITPQGSAWIDSYVPVQTDLRSVHGSQTGTVLDSVVQEIDIKTGLVMFEWHPLGHIALSESYTHPSTTQPWDAFHVNSIEPQGDHLVLSARNTWAVYEVSLQTGNIVWRLGGKRSNFQMGPSTRFAYQHDAQLRPDGTVSMFDNEAAPQVGHQSRGVVLAVNGQAANVVREYTHPRALIAGSQGSVQTLSNGDEFVGWGSEPYFSEYTSDGRLILDGEFDRPVQSYRAFRMPWTGTPTTQPAVVAASAGSGQVNVYASWNGATQVASWQVLAGPDPGHLSPVGSAPDAGFETTIHVGTSQPYVAARALDASGHELQTSPAIRS